MKHKSLLFILAVAMVTPLTSCDSLFGGGKNETPKGIGNQYGGEKHAITDSEGLFDFKYEDDCTLENDITLIPEEGFLTWGDVNVKKSTLDGKGHTITIKGDKGDLRNIDGGGYSLWYSMNACTVKNLNIVYDYAFEYKGKVEPVIGGLVATAESCIFDNVHITYKKGHTVDNSAYCEGNLTDPCFAGGFAAKVWNSHLNNCSVTGKVNYTTYLSGGLVGFFSDSVMSYCKFDGDLQHTGTGYLWQKRDDDFISYTGGLVGVVRPASKVYGSEVEIQSVTFNRKNNGWRTEVFEYGMAFGHILGSVRDIRISFKENPVFNYSPSQTYDRTYVGALAGGASKDSQISNIMIDISKGGDAFKKSQIAKIDGFIENNSCSSISNIYTVGDFYKEGKQCNYTLKDPWVKDTAKRFANLDKFYGITKDFTYLSVTTNAGYDDATLNVKHMELVNENRIGDRLIMTQDMITTRKNGDHVVYCSEDIKRSISYNYTFYWRVEFEPLDADFMNFNIGIYGLNCVFEISKYIKYIDDQTTISFADNDATDGTDANRWVVKDGQNIIDKENQVIDPYDYFEPSFN